MDHLKELKKYKKGEGENYFDFDMDGHYCKTCSCFYLKVNGKDGCCFRCIKKIRIKKINEILK